MEQVVETCGCGTLVVETRAVGKCDDCPKETIAVAIAFTKSTVESCCLLAVTGPSPRLTITVELSEIFLFSTVVFWWMSVLLKVQFDPTSVDVIVILLWLVLDTSVLMRPLLPNILLAHPDPRRERCCIRWIRGVPWESSKRYRRSQDHMA